MTAAEQHAAEDRLRDLMVLGRWRPTSMATERMAREISGDLLCDLPDLGMAGADCKPLAMQQPTRPH